MAKALGHEIIGHKGLRAVFGENFDALLELDEIKKPSSPDKGGLDEQANTPALDGCDKLIQKIKNASAKIKNRKNDNFRFSVSGDGTDFNGNERNGTELNGQKLDEDYFAALERGDLQAADAMVNNQYRICWRQQSKKKTPER